MNIKKAIFIGIFITIFLFSTGIVFAQPRTTVLPIAVTDCPSDAKDLTDSLKGQLNSEAIFKEAVRSNSAQLSGILGCAVRLGKIRMYMVPFFITYLIEVLLGIAGLVAVLFVVYGGFLYVKGGITEDKESGKKTILHALMGLVVALSAWIAVNFIQVALTS